MFSPRGTYSASKRDRPEYLQTNAIITLLRASWVTIISFFDFDPRYIYIYHKWFASFEEAKKRSGGWRDNPYGMCDQRLHFNYALVEERRPRLLFGQPNPRPDHLFFFSGSRLLCENHSVQLYNYSVKVVVNLNVLFVLHQ
jgi:hypothetical protein